jgi:TPR repeat protein
MRTRDRIASLAALGLALGLTPGFAFEGTTRPPADVAPPPPPVSRTMQGDVPRPPGTIPRAGGSSPAATAPSAALPRPRAPVPVVSAPAAAVDRPMAPPTAFAPAAAMPVAPFEALKSGTRALKDGQNQKALVALEYAADQGVVAAKWKLGRMYADGDGVERSDLKAFEYFSSIADDHADDNPSGPNARYVANAFVSLGHYYRRGIPQSDVRADLGRARRVYDYAASYYRDPDAQYHLARLMLENGPYRDPRQGARWLLSAANKGQTHAQAVLGRMLFKGENAPRQPARGLMWLTLAKTNAGPADAWIGEIYDAAISQATIDERALANDMLENWLNSRRD